jgi:hypothetical protein
MRYEYEMLTTFASFSSSSPHTPTPLLEIQLLESASTRSAVTPEKATPNGFLASASLLLNLSLLLFPLDGTDLSKSGT